jgi:hypothetical protein
MHIVNYPHLSAGFQCYVVAPFLSVIGLPIMDRTPPEAPTLPPGFNPLQNSFRTLRRAPVLLQSPKPATVLPTPSPPRRLLPLAPAPTTSPHHIRPNLPRPSTENPVAMYQPTPLTTPLLISKATEKPSTSFRVSNIRPIRPAPSKRATVVSDTPLPPVATRE